MNEDQKKFYEEYKSLCFKHNMQLVEGGEDKLTIISLFVPMGN